MITKLELLYEGKAKKVYNTTDPNLIIVDYKDSATAFNGEKKGTIFNKGKINNKVTNHLMKILEKNNINTHFIKEISDNESIVKKVSIIPIEVIVRNVSCGSLSKRLGIEDGTVLEETVLEYCYKDDNLGDPMINEYHIYAIKLATKSQLQKISTYSFKINEILSNYLIEKNLELIDFKLEFGVDINGDIILADEISSDTCRLWDKTTKNRLDKDRFRFNLDNVEFGYQEIYKRLLV